MKSYFVKKILKVTIVSVLLEVFKILGYNRNNLIKYEVIL